MYFVCMYFVYLSTCQHCIVWTQRETVIKKNGSMFVITQIPYFVDIRLLPVYENVFITSEFPFGLMHDSLTSPKNEHLRSKTLRKIYHTLLNFS